MKILHASTDPTLLARLKEMLASSARADIAVGYFFMSGFEQVALCLPQAWALRAGIARQAVDTDALDGMVYDLYDLSPSDITLISDWFERRSLVN